MNKRVRKALSYFVDGELDAGTDHARPVNCDLFIGRPDNSRDIAANPRAVAQSGWRLAGTGRLAARCGLVNHMHRRLTPTLHYIDDLLRTCRTTRKTSRGKSCALTSDFYCGPVTSGVNPGAGGGGDNPPPILRAKCESTCQYASRYNPTSSKHKFGST